MSPSCSTLGIKPCKPHPIHPTVFYMGTVFTFCDKISDLSILKEEKQAEERVQLVVHLLTKHEGLTVVGHPCKKLVAACMCL